MAVAHDQRTLPLARNPDNPAAAGITLAWDFTGMGSLPEAQPFLFGGGSAPSLTVSGNRSYPTYNGIQGVRPGGSGASGSYNNLTFTGQGMQVGTGDFQVAVIFTTGPTLPTSTNTIKALVIRNDAGTALVDLTISESNGNGWFLNANSSTGEGTAVTATIYGVNKTVILWFRRRAGVTNVWTQEATPTSILVARYNAGSDSTDWTDTSAKRIYIAWNQSTTAVVDVAIHGVRFWGGSSLDDEATRNVGRDFWALEANEVESDSLAITSPAAGSSVPTTTTISGTYTGTAPTGVDVQHGAASWVTLSGFSAAGGTWSGAAVLAVASAAALRARYGNNTAIVSADVANITVEADAIAFTVPMIGADPDPMGAVDYRLFQRDGANQATGVRVTGTYDGDPEGAIEWRYNGGSWATLDATPTGGEFDEVVTLQGPAQGALEVRFAANPSVSAALSYVGVGDLYLCAGQSNAAGWSPSYLQPVAPAANPTWKAVEFDFAHVWRENFETLAKPFHIPSDAVYTAFNAGGAGDGSYYGHLATLAMESGVPIGVVPAARGSTNIDQWNAGSPSNTGTLYGAMLATAQKLGSFRYVLWWQGEGSMSDTATGTAYDPTLYAGKLDEIMDAFAAAGQTAQWVLTMPCLANPEPKANGVLLRSAIASLSSNEHVAGVLDLDDPTPAYDTLHFEGSTEIITIAERMAALLGYTTAPVQVDVPIRWNMQAAVSTAASIRWSLQQPVQKDAAVRWSMLQPATAEAIARWSMLASVTKPQAIRWDLLEAVQQDRTVAWQLLQAAQADATLRWSMLEAVQADAAILWNLAATLGTVTAEFVARWSLLAPVQADASVHWNLLQAVAADAPVRWDMLQSAERADAVRWSLLEAVRADRTLRWAMLGAVRADATAAWNLLQAVQVDASLRWDLITAGVVFSTFDVRWSMLAAVEKSVAARWSLLEALQVDAGLRWDMVSAVTREALVRWDLLANAQVVTDAVIRWDVLSASQRDVVIRWRVGDATTLAPIHVHLVPAERRLFVVPPESRITVVAPARGNTFTTH